MRKGMKSRQCNHLKLIIRKNNNSRTSENTFERLEEKVIFHKSYKQNGMFERNKQPTVAVIAKKIQEIIIKKRALDGYNIQTLTGDFSQSNFS